MIRSPVSASSWEPSFDGGEARGFCAFAHYYQLPSRTPWHRLVVKWIEIHE